MFSADQLIVQKRKLDFSITNQCRYQFEAAVFNQERILYSTLSLYRLILTVAQRTNELLLP